jgi:L,D-transpeptidase ErfK/SrfK
VTAAKIVTVPRAARPGSRSSIAPFGAAAGGSRAGHAGCCGDRVTMLARVIRHARCLVPVGVLAAGLLAGCVARPLHPPGHDPRLAAAAGPPAEPAGKAVRITQLPVRVPAPLELPAVIGRLQRHRVEPGENLLTIARDAGVGFRELRDANPTIDEWEPKPGSVLLVPTQWILPRASAHRGIVINVAELRLYLFPEDTFPGERVPMLTWPVGVGAENVQTPLGPFTVRSKDTYPTWVVPDSIYRKMEKPRRVVPPGPDNPLGDHRIRLSLDLYAIHGTNDPWTVGRLTTHGCIRLYPEDVAYLYEIVGRDTPGEFVYQPVKLGAKDGRIFVEVHRDIYQKHRDLEAHALAEVHRAGLAGRVDLEALREAVRAQLGIPVDVTRVTAVAETPPAADGRAERRAESRGAGGRALRD